MFQYTEYVPRWDIFKGGWVTHPPTCNFQQRGWILQCVNVIGFHEFDDDWEDGGTRCFYTSSPNESSMDIVETFRDYTVSAEGSDSCILKYERDRKWSLMPISNYFKRVFKSGTKKPGEFHIDLFPIASQDGGIDPESLASAIRGLSRQSFDVQFPIDKFAGITNYSYAGMTGRDSMDEIVSTIVHNYDIGDKTFNIDVKRNSMEAIEERAKAVYAKPMHGKRGKAHLMLPKSKKKKENRTLRQTFSCSSDATKRLISGRNTVMDRLLLLAPTIDFQISGLTYRRAGRFVTIACTQQMPDSPFQDVFQGEWFIVKVEHTFTSGKYRQHLICTKPYAFQEFYKEKKGLL